MAVVLLAGGAAAAQDRPAPDRQLEFGRAAAAAVAAGSHDELAELVRAQPARAAVVVRDLLRTATRSGDAGLAATARTIASAVGDRELRERLAGEVVRWHARDESARAAARAFELHAEEASRALAAGELDAARTAAAAAATAAAAAGEPYLRARARGLRGVVAGRLGEHDPAIAELAAAVALNAELIAAIELRADRRELAMQHERRAAERGAGGDYQAALEDLLRAAELWGAVAERAQEARALVRLGGALSELARFADAEAALRRALALLPPGSAERGRALGTLGTCLLDRGEVDAACAALDEAEELARRSGDAFGEAEACRQRGRALLGRGEPAGAAAAFARATALPGSPLDAALAWTGRGDAARMAGEDAAAAEHYARALEHGRDLAEGRWRAHLGLGLLRWDDPAAALASLDSAVADLEALRNMVRLPELRTRALRERRAPYAAAARLHARRGELAAAFRRAEQLQARTLWEAAAGGTGAAGDARLRELERGLAACERALAEPGADRAALLRRRESLRAEHEIARTRAALRDPRAAVLAGREPAALEAVQAALGDGDALLCYVLDAGGGVCLVVRRGHARSVELALDEDRVARLVGALLAPVRELAAGRVDTANLRFPVGTARELYRDLIEPLALRGVARLWIVADGPLRRLPFAALVSRFERRPVDPAVPYAQYHGVRYLVEQYEHAILPAASLLAAPAPVAAVGPAVVAGHGLPGARAEADAVAAALGVAVAPPAEADLVDSLPGCAVAHLAAHAELDVARPAFARLRLAAGGGADGWLHAHEVAGLSLAAPLVVLSGCDTAGADGAGDGLLGLSRAFLAAGARAVVATHWPVADRASAALMARFHEPGQRADAIASLAAAQRGMLARGRADASGWSHPYFWAGYALYGRP